MLKKFTFVFLVLELLWLVSLAKFPAIAFLFSLPFLVICIILRIKVYKRKENFKRWVGTALVSFTVVNFIIFAGMATMGYMMAKSYKSYMYNFTGEQQYK